MGRNHKLPHPEHIVGVDKTTGRFHVPKLNARTITRRSGLPYTTLVLANKAAQDLNQINTGSSTVQVVSISGVQHFCVISPSGKEMRVYKEHGPGHPSQRLIPEGSCDLSDPTQEGPSVHAATGQQYLELAGLLAHDQVSPTRTSVTRATGGHFPRARGVLQEKNWRTPTETSPGAAVTPAGTIPSPGIVRSCARKLSFFGAAPSILVTPAPVTPVAAVFPASPTPTPPGT